MPELGEGSPEIVILHVDSQTQATQLMIRVPKNFHLARHWHSANETTTTISGTFIVQHGDDNQEKLGPGSFNYIAAKNGSSGVDKAERRSIAVYHRRWRLGHQLGRQLSDDEAIVWSMSDQLSIGLSRT